MNEEDPPPEYRSRCLHRGNNSLPEWMRPDGVGDCSTCKPSHTNKYCRFYTAGPSKIYEFYVYEQED